MPYILPKQREELLIRNAENPGELNFQFTQIAIQYLKDKGECYQHYNDIIGALEGAKLELYRVYCAPYEDEKMEENGKVH